MRTVDSHCWIDGTVWQLNWNTSPFSNYISLIVDSLDRFQYFPKWGYHIRAITWGSELILMSVYLTDMILTTAVSDTSEHGHSSTNSLSLMIQNFWISNILRTDIYLNMVHSVRIYETIYSRRYYSSLLLKCFLPKEFC